MGWGFVIVLCVLNIFVWGARRQTDAVHPTTLSFFFLDGGTGTALLVRTPAGAHLLFGTGSDRRVLRELSRVLPFTSRSIDFFFPVFSAIDSRGGTTALSEQYFRKARYAACIEVV